MQTDALATLATGRTADLFEADLRTHAPKLHERIHGSRILVIGGAGSIGRATVRTLTAFGPAAMVVVDQNENNLAELVRDMRSGTQALGIGELRALPLDFGSSTMHRFLLETAPFDFVLNFAAIKHVRSEKDIYSLLQMLETNVIKQARFVSWMAECGSHFRYFSVSTDKAANPVNLMGASKRIMEHVIFSDEISGASEAQVTSARFANVAFSDGSLLDSFLIRLHKRQPLSVPKLTQRYFVSVQEASEICMLAAFCLPHRHILIPRLDPSRDSCDLQSIAVGVLRHFGFEPRIYDNELDARHGLDQDCASGYYPLLLTSLDTSGEKPFEVFVADDESVVEIGMAHLTAIPYVPAPRGTLRTFLQRVEGALLSPDVRASKEEIVEWVSSVIPRFRHIETGKSLDQRM